MLRAFHEDEEVSQGFSPSPHGQEADFLEGFDEAGVLLLGLADVLLRDPLRIRGCLEGDDEVDLQSHDSGWRWWGEESSDGARQELCDTGASGKNAPHVMAHDVNVK